LFLLFLKATLAPALVGAASLAGRRFGARVAGWLIGFPVVAGPMFWFYAREQGADFAARAAVGTILGVLSLCVFLLVYAWSALRLAWGPSLLLGWAAWALATAGLARLPADPGWQAPLLAAFAALAITLRALPRGAPARSSPRPRHDLALRMLATGLLVVSLTEVAHLLGPALSGLFTPFPVATTVLVVFAHRQGGAGGVLAVCQGFIPSLYSFACFCAALAVTLPRLSLGGAYAVALAITTACQALVLALVSASAPRSAPPAR
jgi:hypothetical protein